MKIKLLVDETIANVIENGVNVGPKRCVAGDIVEVFDGVGDMLVTYGRAKYLSDPEPASKNTEQTKEKVVTKELEEVKPKKNDTIWHTDSKPLPKKSGKKRVGKS